MFLSALSCPPGFEQGGGLPVPGADGRGGRRHGADGEGEEGGGAVLLRPRRAAGTNFIK